MSALQRFLKRRERHGRHPTAEEEVKVGLSYIVKRTKTSFRVQTSYPYLWEARRPISALKMIKRRSGPPRLSLLQ